MVYSVEDDLEFHITSIELTNDYHSPMIGKVNLAKKMKKDQGKRLTEARGLLNIRKPVRRSPDEVDENKFNCGT